VGGEGREAKGDEGFFGEGLFQHCAGQLVYYQLADQLAASSALRRPWRGVSARCDFMAGVPRLTARGLGAGSRPPSRGSFPSAW
jgi:hypothetical protein